MSKELEERFARAIDPELWAKIDHYADDDDWNGGTAANARHHSLRVVRSYIERLSAAGLVIVPREPTEDRIRQAVVAMLLDRFSDRYSGDPVMHEPEAQLLAGIVLAALDGGK